MSENQGIVPDNVLMDAALRLLRHNSGLDKKPYLNGEVYGDRWLEAAHKFLSAIHEAGYVIVKADENE